MKYRFSTFSELSSILVAEGLEAPEFAIRREAFLAGRPEAEIISELDRRIAVTRSSLSKGLGTPQRSRSGLTAGAAVAYAKSRRRVAGGGLLPRAVAYSLAVNEVNACGGKVVSFPTAGSSGIAPGAIWAWWDERAGTSAPEAGNPYEVVLPSIAPEPPFDPLLRGAFLVAGLVGVLIAQGATLAGSEGGCQAECGSAGAMAAAALAYLEGLDLEAQFAAAALSLKNSLGLACDPVAGLVEVPCVKRNGFVVANALVATDLVLAGVRSAIPFDEVVQAMKSIGDSLPRSLRENAEGGLAATPTGLAYKNMLSASGEDAPPARTRLRPSAP